VNRAWLLSLAVSGLCMLAQAQSTVATSGAQVSQVQSPAGQNTPGAKLGVFVYPKNNQSPQQQQKDENECYSWAKQQTAIDPGAPSTPAPQQAQKAQGGGVRGAAGGAAGGAAIGAIAGDAGEGAAIGATAGAVRGRRQQRKANKQAEQQAKQQAGAQQQQGMSTFRNAFSSCIDARGYSVR